MEDDLVTAFLYTEQMVLQYNLTQKNDIFTQDLPIFRLDATSYLLMYLPGMFNIYYQFP